MARSQQTGNRFVESKPHDLRERANLRRTRGSCWTRQQAEDNSIPETPEESSVSAAGPEVQAFQAPVFHRSLNSNHQFQSRRSPVAVQE